MMSGMGWAMNFMMGAGGLITVLIIIALILGIAALLRYLIGGKED